MDFFGLTSVSGMTISQLEEQIGEYSLRVIERQPDGTTLEEEIPGKEIGISYISTEPLEAVLQGQNRFLWFIKQNTDYRTDEPPFYDNAALEKKIGELRGFQKEFIEEPKDAYIADYVPGKGFELAAEKQGNRLNREKTMEAIKAAVNGLEKQVDLDAAGCYEEPYITTEDAELKKSILGIVQSDLRYMHFADRNLFEFAVRDEKKQNWDRKEAHIWNER